MASALPSAADLDAPHDVVVQAVAFVNNEGHHYGTHLKNNIRRPKIRTNDTVTYSVVLSYDSKPSTHV